MADFEEKLKKSSARHLPVEIISNILSMLPVKDLIRFTSVCKSWYSLLTSPNFINMHFNHSIVNDPNNPGCLLSLPKEFKVAETNLCSVFRDETFELHETFNFPYHNRSVVFQLSDGCCNGLILLSDADRNLYLCNPSLRKVVTIPRSGLSPEPRSNLSRENIETNKWRCVTGFGIDKVINDVNWRCVTGSGSEYLQMEMRNWIWK